jgi:hypothetical protein
LSCTIKERSVADTSAMNSVLARTSARNSQKSAP